jgi:hypothetical protein
MAVKPFNRRISGWQTEAVLLRARINSGYLKVEDRAAARAEAGGMAHQIVQELLELELVVADLPTDIRASSRIDDTFRAMRQVVHGLRGALVSNAIVSEGGA